MSRRGVIAICLLLSLGLVHLSPAQKAPRKKPARKAAPAAKASAAPLRTKIAEGRYELRAHEGGTLKTWDEPWTVFKTSTGYEIEELWKASKEGVANAVVIDVLLTMAPGLYPTQVRIGSQLSPAQLHCSMTMNEFRCSADAKQNVMPMSGAYNFFLPSPWLLSSIARRAPKKPDRSIQVQLVQMIGMDENGPKLAQHSAEVAYIGEDQVDVGGIRYAADIYEIRGPDVPPIIVWISNEGVVLMMQDAGKPEQRMELVEFKRISPF